MLPDITKTKQFLSFGIFRTKKNCPALKPRISSKHSFKYEALEKFLKLQDAQAHFIIFLDRSDFNG